MLLCLDVADFDSILHQGRVRLLIALAKLSFGRCLADKCMRFLTTSVIPSTCSHPIQSSSPVQILLTCVINLVAWAHAATLSGRKLVPEFPTPIAYRVATSYDGYNKGPLKAVPTV